MPNTRKMVNQYLETALWAEYNNDDYPDDDCPPRWDDDYDSDDFTDEAKEKAKHDCRRFLELLEATPWPGYDNLHKYANEFGDDEQIGHDFWLTRNDCGIGFWDGGYGDCGDCITQIVRDNFSECCIYVTNGDLHFS